MGLLIASQRPIFNWSECLDIGLRMTGYISSSIVATQLAFLQALCAGKNPAKVIHRSALDDHDQHVTTRLRPRVYAQVDEHQRERER